MKTCSQCEKEHYARGMCVNHYMQWRRAAGGTAPKDQPPPRSSPTKRFWAKVQKTETCWLWTASTKKVGYGWFKLNEKQVAAHRFAYELLVGPIPAGLDLDHLCNVRNCVNPEHLEPVTKAENNRRQVPRRKTCKHGHPYGTDNYWMVSAGHGRRARRCKTCASIRRKQRYVETGE